MTAWHDSGPHFGIYRYLLLPFASATETNCSWCFSAHKHSPTCILHPAEKEGVVIRTTFVLCNPELMFVDSEIACYRFAKVRAQPFKPALQSGQECLLDQMQLSLSC